MTDNNPKIIAETPRLSLRELTMADAEDLQRILADPDVMKYSIGGPMDLEKTKAYLKKTMKSYEQNGFGAWAVIEKSSGDLIGFCGLSYQPVNDKEEIELGYRLAKAHWGKGFGTEAAAACKDFAFHVLKLNKLISIIEPTNLASLRVAQKMGFTLLQSQILFHGISVNIYGAKNQVAR